MSNIIILSIHKRHADNILAGKKIYEFRKNKPKKSKPPLSRITLRNSERRRRGCDRGRLQNEQYDHIYRVRARDSRYGRMEKDSRGRRLLIARGAQGVRKRQGRLCVVREQPDPLQRALAALEARPHPSAYELALFIIV